MNLGRIGVWSTGLRGRDTGRAAEAAAELETLGYGTLWFPPGNGRGFEIAQNLLAATTSTTVATGILSVWTQEPEVAAAGFDALELAAPGRFLLGLGVSHGPLVDRGAPGTYAKPLATMRTYLDALGPHVPADRMIIAAHGPKMLELALERTAGTHTYLVLPEHTARIREAIGAGPVIAAEQAVILVADPDEARAIARRNLAMYLSLPNYVNNWLRLGFTDADVAEGGSDRLIDALVAHGGEEQIAARVNEHFAAGADHVCIQVLGSGDHEALPLVEWCALAAALNQ